MHTQRIKRGEENAPKATDRPIAAARLAMTLLILMTLAMVAIGGCAQAEKVSYMRHLTTVVEPNASVPEEAILTFNIDRKKVEGAVAVAAER